MKSAARLSLQTRGGRELRLCTGCPSAAHLEREPAAWWHFLLQGNMFIEVWIGADIWTWAYCIWAGEVDFLNVTELKSRPVQGSSTKCTFPPIRGGRRERNQSVLTPARSHQSAYFYFLSLLWRMMGSSETPTKSGANTQLNIFTFIPFVQKLLVFFWSLAKGQSVMRDELIKERRRRETGLSQSVCNEDRWGDGGVRGGVRLIEMGSLTTGGGREWETKRGGLNHRSSHPLLCPEQKDPIKELQRDQFHHTHTQRNTGLWCSHPSAELEAAENRRRSCLSSSLSKHNRTHQMEAREIFCISCLEFFGVFSSELFSLGS